MNLGAESFTNLLLSFCSQPVPTEDFPDLGELEEEEEDKFEHLDSQIDSSFSSQDEEKNVPKDSVSHSYKASPDFFNAPDEDDTEEHTTQSQRTQTPVASIFSEVVSLENELLIWVATKRFCNVHFVVDLEQIHALEKRKKADKYAKKVKAKVKKKMHEMENTLEPDEFADLWKGGD
ncbi:hypothetical protein ZWY2020_037441 [Hordeum vulgare]|nr:hypothetical protein ZWY2020_037441 [Hordeum vulgare]